ncbi:N-acetylmuramoyl-L-alanine amidase LytC [Desulfitobacterium hafniense]|uniref:N-acetylmuramoyl-L-alanine amidase LytC n=1 Tax=Desulfitobacterium hafniense TaxID=49338 RepID=A0A098B4W7_DESHA|nr:cell wall-binding repeat-containing protein [Desulfitobacterium hafniense]CDX03420.1 N-acetylmuramoyl-L-alanine amidase LytC [Desulfitobacterium hafniense]
MKKKYSMSLLCFLLIFSLLSISIPVSANPTTTSVSLDKSTIVLTIGQTDTLTATVLPAGTPNQNLTWISSNPNVVNVFNGLLMGLNEGTAYITVMNPSASSNYASCFVIVKKPDSEMTINKTNLVLPVGSTETLTVNISPSQAVNWNSSNPEIVRVFNGVLMAQKVGTAVITATAADGSKSVTCTVTVKDAKATITLNKSTATLGVGKTTTLTANVSPALPSNVYLMWQSSNPGIVSVSGGVITGVSLGSAVITAIASDGSSSATCNVNVTATGINTIRLGGANRYETSVQISKNGWPDGSTYAVLATGNNYPDALSAAPLAQKYDAPILLTDKTLPQVTINELTRLKPTQIFICGGTGAISKTIENQLNSMGIITERLEGKDRYETSIAIAKKIGVTSGELIVVNGYEWSDALSVSPIAAKKGIPIVLTDKGSIPDSVKSFVNSSNFSKTYLLGGTDLIGNQVKNVLPNAERIIGSNKFERNINILKEFEDDLDLSKICIATGADFPDALSGSALAATLSSAIVLVDNNSLKSVTSQYSADSLIQTDDVYVFGLQAVVSDNVINKLFTK